MWLTKWYGENSRRSMMDKPERIRIIGVDISVVNFEKAQKYLFENFEDARGRYICAANVDRKSVV